MTNAEKYLKDGVDIKEFSRNMFNYLVNRDEPLKIKIENYLKEDIKPTLTEDERVILRNIKDYYTISRNGFGNIMVLNKNAVDKEPYHSPIPCFNHLFQFIKERRRL